MWVQSLRASHIWAPGLRGYIAVITENQMEEKMENEMERDFVGVWCVGFRFLSSKYRTNY